jgi:hypothetical protein
MDKKFFLKEIAQSAYNIGFGAKKHFATYDVIEKSNGYINFISIALGILSLIYDVFSYKLVSAILLILGVAGMYISYYDSKKDEYNNAGKEMIKLFDRLKVMYGNVISDDNFSYSNYESDYHRIKDDFNKLAISKQIFLSDWYAHYKFFCQHQVDWINNELNLKFWKDKVPSSLKILIFISVLIVACFLIKLYDFTSLTRALCIS